MLRGLALGAWLGGALACRREEPPATSTPAVASASSHDASHATTPDAHADAGRQGADAPEHRIPGGDPTLLAAPTLFRPGAVYRFRVSDTVDPHDVHGGSITTKGEVELSICQVEWSATDAGAPQARARGEFTDLGSEGLATFISTSSFLATTDTLSLPDGPPGTLRRPLTGKRACLEEHEPGPYGVARARVCFDAQGPLSYRLQNRAGPRITEALRVGAPTMEPGRCP